RSSELATGGMVPRKVERVLVHPTFDYTKRALYDDSLPDDQQAPLWGDDIALVKLASSYTGAHKPFVKIEPEPVELNYATQVGLGYHKLNNCVDTPTKPLFFTPLLDARLPVAPFHDLARYVPASDNRHGILRDSGGPLIFERFTGEDPPNEKDPRLVGVFSHVVLADPAQR